MNRDTHRWSETKEATLRQLLARGRSRPEIATALDVSMTALLGKMQRLGLKPPKGGAYEAAMRRAETHRLRIAASAAAEGTGGALAVKLERAVVQQAAQTEPGTPVDDQGSDP